MKVKIIGKQHLNGTSRKTGNPYDFSVVHFNCTQSGVEGLSATTVNLGREIIAYNDIRVGEDYDLEFGVHGIIVGFTPVKKF